MQNQGMFNQSSGGIKAFDMNEAYQYPGQHQQSYNQKLSYDNSQIQPSQQVQHLPSSVKFLNQQDRNSVHSNPTNQQKKKKPRQGANNKARGQAWSETNNKNYKREQFDHIGPQPDDEYYREDGFQTNQGKLPGR